MAKAKKENSESSDLSLKNEIFAVFSLFLLFFLIFSLVSFTPLDPSFFRSAHGRVVHNFGGRVGAELAAILFNLFGAASVLFIIIAFFLTAYFLFNRRISNAVSKGIGFFLLLISAAALLTNLWPWFFIAGQPVRSGGMIGLLLNDLVSAQIKSFFAALLFLSLLAVSLVLIAKISIKNISLFLWDVAKKSAALLAAFIQKRIENIRKNKSRQKVQQKYVAEGNFVFQGKQPLKEREKEILAPSGKESADQTAQQISRGDRALSGIAAGLRARPHVSAAAPDVP